jgi:hypothetical protein
MSLLARSAMELEIYLRIDASCYQKQVDGFGIFILHRALLIDVLKKLLKSFASARSGLKR